MLNISLSHQNINLQKYGYLQVLIFILYIISSNSEASERNVVHIKP